MDSFDIKERFGLIFLCLLIIYLQFGQIVLGIAGGYHGIEAEQAKLIRLHAIFYGIPLISIFFIIFSGCAIRKRDPWVLIEFEASMILYFGIYGGFAALLGVILQNKTVYIIGDLFRSFITIISYFVTKYFLKRNSIRNAIRLFWIIILVENLYIGYGLYLNIKQLFFSYEFSRLVYQSLLAFTNSLVRFTNNQYRKTIWFWAIASIIILFQHFLTLSRNIFILSILSIILIGILEYNKRSLKRLIVFILIAFAIFSIGVGFSNLSMEVPITRLSTPFARSILGLPALQGRIYEIVNALENLRENLFNMVFGFGYGAEVQLLENYIPYNLRFKYILEHRAGLMHNIHNGYVSILYRTGLLGLIFFIYFQTSTLKFIFRTVKLAKSKNYKVYLILFTILIYIILSYIKFFVTYMIIGNIVFAMLLAIVMTLHQELKSN